MLEDERIVGYGCVTSYYASEVGGMLLANLAGILYTGMRGGNGARSQNPITDHYPNTNASRIEVTESNVSMKRLCDIGASRFWNITRWCWTDKWKRQFVP